MTIRDLLKASLRMRPDRIIVGEIRGAEAIDMLQAMNTGHDGSLSTGHSNSAKDMIPDWKQWCLWEWICRRQPLNSRLHQQLI